MEPGEIIRAARIAHKPRLSQKKLGGLIGVSQVTIKKIESGETVKSKHLAMIAQVLELDLAKLDLALARSVNHPRIRKVPDATSPLVTIPGSELTGADDLPVHASAQGGRGALVVSTDPVDWTTRPASLARVKDAYGVIVSENSMAPEYEPGDIALVNPHLPPKVGRTCVFYSEGKDGAVEACIKRLRKDMPEAWHVTQFNPKRNLILKKAQWQKCHVTVANHKGG